MLTRLSSIATLLLALVVAPACGNKPIVLVAQTGQTLAGSIGSAARANTQLQQGGVITPQQALVVAKALEKANDQLKPLPDLLIAIDNATQAGQTDAARIDAALAILRAVGISLDDVVAGLPVGETASNVLQAVTEARKLIAQITEALARRSSNINDHTLPALAVAA